MKMKMKMKMKILCGVSLSTLLVLSSLALSCHAHPLSILSRHILSYPIQPTDQADSKAPSKQNKTRQD